MRDFGIMTGRGEAMIRSIAPYVCGVVLAAMICLGFASIARHTVRRQEPAKQVEARILDVLVRDLHLDSSQKSKVNSILDEALQSARPIDSELRTVRGNLIRALAEGCSENEIERLEREYTIAFTRMASLEAAALGRIFALLDAGQRLRAKGAFDRIGSIVQRPPKLPTRGFGQERNSRRRSAPSERLSLI
jgi:hypothetical protein